MTRRLSVLASILLGAAILCGPARGWAQEGETEEAKLTEGATVRNKLLYRSARFEVSPLFGMTLGDSYLRNVVGGLNLSYYMTNELGIGLNAGYGVFHPETDIATNMKEALRGNNQSRLGDLRLSYVQWMAGLEFLYVPIFGKFSVMNAFNAHYDIHLIGGFTMVGRAACRAAQCPSGDPGPNTNLGGATPAGTIGMGLRFFVADAYAVNIQVRDHVYQRAEISTGNAEPAFANNLFLSLGFSFFLPQEVRISR